MMSPQRETGAKHVKDEEAGHWDRVYATREASELSWWQPHLACSLRLIEGIGLPLTASIIDVGGGNSTLVDDLLARGYERVTVLDISATALEQAKRRLGEKAAKVEWIVGDIVSVSLPQRAFDLWHDRAAFHFLVSQESRCRYLENLRRALKPGGHLILATFAETGPTMCSGLPTMRYSADELARVIGAEFKLIESLREEHRTPAGAKQDFICTHFTFHR